MEIWTRSVLWQFTRVLFVLFRFYQTHAYHLPCIQLRLIVKERLKRYIEQSILYPKTMFAKKQETRTYKNGRGQNGWIMSFYLNLRSGWMLNFLFSFILNYVCSTWVKLVFTGSLFYARTISFHSAKNSNYSNQAQSNQHTNTLKYIKAYTVVTVCLQ